MDFKNMRDREFYIKDMQNVAVGMVDKLNKENKKLLRIRRKEAKEKGETLDENGIKYGYVNERKLALTSYIANFPESVNDECIKKLAEVKIGRYEGRSKAKAKGKKLEKNSERLGYYKPNFNEVYVADNGKFRVINDMNEKVLIHEMVHATSFVDLRINNESYPLNKVLEEGITEAKTQRIISSVEYRQLQEKYDIKPLYSSTYPNERIIALSIDIFTDGQLFKAHCEDGERFEKVLESVFSKSEKLKENCWLYGKRNFVTKSSQATINNTVNKIFNILLPLLREQEVTENNILHFTDLYNIAKNFQNIEGYKQFADVMFEKVKNFQFDGEVSKLMKEDGVVEGDTFEQKVAYLKWLDDKGLTKNNIEAKVKYQLIRHTIIKEEKMEAYYEEACAAKPKGALTEGDIWQKAGKIAEFRGDARILHEIEEYIKSSRKIKRSITKKEEEKLYDKKSGEYLPEKRLREIIEANSNNQAYLKLSEEEKLKYIKTLYQEDSLLCEVCEQKLNDLALAEKKKNDKWAKSVVGGMKYEK